LIVAGFDGSTLVTVIGALIAPLEARKVSSPVNVVLLGRHTVSPACALSIAFWRLADAVSVNVHAVLTGSGVEVGGVGVGVGVELGNVPYMRT
jgi:hypothetical protein